MQVRFIEDVFEDVLVMANPSGCFDASIPLQRAWQH